MIVFIDTNLILDIMLANSNFLDESASVLSYCNKGYDFYISAASCTDIYYIVKRSIKDDSAVKQIMQNLLKTIYIAGVDETCVRRALDSSWKDFEDSIQHEVAQQIRADLIITRNVSDYKQSAIRVMTPSEFLSFVLSTS